MYPEQVAALPVKQLSTLLQTLEWGIAAPEAEAVQSALEALAALANFDYQSKQAGQPNLLSPDGTYCIHPVSCCLCSHSRGQWTIVLTQLHQAIHNVDLGVA